MKNYKEYDKVFLGGSDIASLIMVGCGEHGLKMQELRFGGDGYYEAYLVDYDAEIGEHYSEVAEFRYWLRIYDDDKKTFEITSHKPIKVYQAGSRGTIIQVEDITELKIR